MGSLDMWGEGDETDRAMNPISGLYDSGIIVSMPWTRARRGVDLSTGLKRKGLLWTCWNGVIWGTSGKICPVDNWKQRLLIWGNNKVWRNRLWIFQHTDWNTRCDRDRRGREGDKKRRLSLFPGSSDFFCPCRWKGGKATSLLVALRFCSCFWTPCARLYT